MSTIVRDQPITAYAVERLALEAAAMPDATAPDRVLLAPWGEVRSANGTFIVDEEAVEETLRAFAHHGTDIPIDYEHQTLGGAFSSPNGQAPAAGWVREIRAVAPGRVDPDLPDAEPGLWAFVNWTDTGRDKVKAREYRYLSPVALVRRADRRLVGLHSAALTNKPAIVGMRAIVNATTVACIDGAPPPEDHEDGLDRLRHLLQLDESATEDIVLVAAADRISAEVETRETEDAERRVEGALRAGKLAPAQREWALSLARRDPAEFDRWESAAPILVPTGRTAAPPTSDSSSNSASRRQVEHRARAEYRAHRAQLTGLCSEDAFVADALRMTCRDERAMQT